MIKETMYCDRCGKKCEYTRDCHGFRLMKHRYFIERWMNGVPVKLDMCQSCYDSLAEWMKTGNAESEEQTE